MKYRNDSPGASEKLGATWTYNDAMEKVLKLKDTNEDRFNHLCQTGAINRMSVGYYENAKAAAAAIGMNTRPPAA